MKIHSLDQLMFSVARGFTAAILFLFALPIVILGVSLALATFITFVFGVHMATAFHGCTLAFQALFERPSQLLGLAFAILWFASIRFLPNKVARICMGATSAVFVATFTTGMIPLLFHPRLSVLWFTLPLSLIAVVGFGAILWVCIRSHGVTTSSENSVKFR